MKDLVLSFSKIDGKIDDELKKELQKGVFPHDAINALNYEEVLSNTEPFSQKDFHDKLTNSDISDKDYKAYLEDTKQFSNRWEYLKHYNIRDTECMINPIDNIIKLNWEHKVDTLFNHSLSSNAASIKYSNTYKDFDPNI